MAAPAVATAPDPLSRAYLQQIRDFGSKASTQIREKAGELKALVSEKAKSWSITLGHAGKNVADSLDPMYRGISESLQLLDSREKTDAVARPGLAAVNNAVSFLDLAWALKSVHYFSCGDFKKDIKKRQFWSIGTQVALAVARTISTLHFFVRQKLDAIEKMAGWAMNIGGARCYNAVKAALGDKVMLWAFAVGFTGLLRYDISGMYEGEKKVHHMFSAMSTLSYIALMVLSAKKFASPGALLYLGTQAAVTGFAAYLANRN